MRNKQNIRERVYKIRQRNNFIEKMSKFPEAGASSAEKDSRSWKKAPSAKGCIPEDVVPGILLRQQKMLLGSQRFARQLDLQRLFTPSTDMRKTIIL